MLAAACLGGLLVGPLLADEKPKQDRNGGTRPPQATPAPRVAPAPPSTAPGAPAPAAPVIVLPAPVVTGCWTDPRWFYSLAGGYVPYCRGHLAYAPDVLDCYGYAEEVCSVYSPANGLWSEARRPLPPTIFACPEAPEPPVCPRLVLH